MAAWPRGRAWRSLRDGACPGPRRCPGACWLPVPFLGFDTWKICLHVRVAPSRVRPASARGAPLCGVAAVPGPSPPRRPGLHAITCHLPLRARSRPQALAVGASASFGDLVPPVAFSKPVLYRCEHRGQESVKKPFRVLHRPRSRSGLHTQALRPSGMCSPARSHRTRSCLGAFLPPALTRPPPVTEQRAVP